MVPGSTNDTLWFGCSSHFVIYCGHWSQGVHITQVNVLFIV